MTASRTLVVVVLRWFCAWMHSVYRSAEKMGSPLLRCPPRVPYLSTWHAASPQGRLCHVPIFQLPTLDPTHLRNSQLDRLLSSRECKSTFCFEAASVSSTMAKPWFQPKKKHPIQDHALDTHKATLTESAVLQLCMPALYGMPA